MRKEEMGTDPERSAPTKQPHDSPPALFQEPSKQTWAKDFGGEIRSWKDAEPADMTRVDGDGKDRFGPGARASDPDTSKAAAVETPSRTVMRQLVLEALRNAGDRGLTDAELCHALPALHCPSLGRRRKDVERAGFCIKTAQKRPTGNGEGMGRVHVALLPTHPLYGVKVEA